MQTVTITLPEMHPAQRRIITEARRFNVLNCGRRFGKDILGHDRIIGPALDGKPCAWFAPTYKMLAENWRDLRNVLAPILRKANEQEKRLEMVTGGVIEMWSLDNQDAARGRHYARVIINEAAMIAGLLDAWNMVIRPTLIDLAGDAWFLSTPRGLNGFYALWQQAESTDGWARWRYPTDANPHIPSDEVQAIRAALPERVVRQEIDAEFVEDGAYFQNVDKAAVILEPDQPEQHTGHTIFLGVDWAKSEDYTVIVAACRECGRVVDWDRFNRIDYTFQREKLRTMAARWKARGILPERNSIGEPNIELIDFAHVVIGPDGKRGYNTTATTKPNLIEGLARALAFDGYKVPAAAADELRSYEIELGSNGHPRFGAIKGGHDDWVIALALAWQAAKRPRGIGLA